MNMASYENIRRLSRGKFSYPRFIELKELADSTIGCSNESDEQIINSILNLYDAVVGEIEAIESRIKLIMSQLHSPVETIPGIGYISAATIISEYGDIGRFPNADKMLAFAGLDCGRSQSGTQDFKGKMVKHGSSYLREAIFNVSETVVLNCPAFYEYYHKKRSEGKPHRVALSHVARKLVRIIYKLVSTNTSFSLAL